MGLFENFPYTNFHNLNLDWIIKILKNAVAELEEIQTNWESVRDTANTAKTTADAAAVKAENARTTANGAMTKADSAETKAKNADANAELALVQSTQAQDAATSAEAAANEAKEIAARAESTASAAKTTADGVDAKATTALTNSQNAVTTANAAKTTADGLDVQVKTAQSAADAAYDIAGEADKTATSADSKVDALTTTVNSVGKTANDAMSLAKTNEKDIAANDADIAEIRKFLTAPNETLMQPGGYYSIAVGDVNYTIPENAEVYTQLIPVTISDGIVTTLTQLESATDGDNHLLYRLDYVPQVWLVVDGNRKVIPAVATRSTRNTLLIAATSNIAYNTTDGGLHYNLAVVCNLVGINQYISTPT